MKHIFSSLMIIVAATSCIISQTVSINKGAYASLSDLLDNKPIIDETNYDIEKTFPVESNEEVGVYKIRATNSDYKSIYFRKNIFAVTKNDNLYINSKMLDITPQFCKVVTTGRYITFLVAIKDDEIQKMASVAFGLIGALATANTVEMKLYAYCLDTKTGVSDMLNPARLALS